MANRHRGEIEADIGGARRRLVLTLGALAELEDAFGAEDLVVLTERFGSGRLKARDLTRIIGAGLRGAGAQGRLTPFPWKQAVGFGLGVLRLSPHEFWSMTPRELGYAIEAVTGRSPPLDRSTLA